MDAQSVFWGTITQWKFEIYCLEEMYRRNVAKYRTIKTFTALISSAAVATWAVWNEHPQIWATIVMIAQVVSAICEQIPYSDRIRDLTDVTDQMGEIFTDAELAWFDVASGNLDEEETYSRLGALKQRWNKINKHKLSNDYVGIPRKVSVEAGQMAAAYFAAAYGGSNE